MRSAVDPSMFPILKFYFVIFKHFISIMDPKDLKKLASISKRVQFLIKSSIPKNRYKLEIYFDLYPKVNLIHGDSITEFDMKTVELFSELPDENGVHSILPFTGEFIKEMTSKADSLSTTFNCNFNYLNMESDFCSGQIGSVVDWMNSRQPSIERCTLGGFRVNDDEILYLIQNCRVTRDFCVHIDPLSHTIRPLHPRLTVDIVRTSHCLSIPWVSLDDASTFDCSEIHLGGGYLYTVTDLNRFLKSWIDGSNERMKYFCIYVPHFNHETLTDGIEVEERDESVVRSYSMLSFFNGLDRKQEGEQQELRGGFDIKSKNGAKLATIQQEPQQHVFEDGTVYTRDLCLFQMIVWK